MSEIVVDELELSQLNKFRVNHNYIFVKLFRHFIDIDQQSVLVILRVLKHENYKYI